jgi:aspartate racemase
MHKKIGMIGGLSPESTVDYYKYIFRTYVERFGDHSYPEIIIYSVNFQHFRDMANADQWDEIAAELIEVGKRLEAAGADFLLLAVNTLHKVYPQVSAGLNLPVLSIMDAVADAVVAKGFKCVGLLGTTFTVKAGFYNDALAKRGIDVLVPDEDDQKFIHSVILDELCNNIIRDESRARHLEIMAELSRRGAEGIVLGCTELQILITPEHTDLPLFDSVELHALAALDYALSGK